MRDIFVEIFAVLRGGVAGEKFFLNILQKFT